MRAWLGGGSLFPTRAWQTFGGFCLIRPGLTFDVEGPGSMEAWLNVGVEGNKAWVGG